MKNLIKKAIIMALFFFFGSVSIIQAQINSVPTMDAAEEVEIPKIFKTYNWLNKLIDYKECKEEKVVVYSHGESRFIYVDKDDKRILYSDDGSFYCGSSEDLNCIEFYKLTEVVNTWECD